MKRKNNFYLSRLGATILIGGLYAANLFANQVSFVFTSDPHFGLNRSVFHEEKNVDARYANAEMVEKINTLPGVMYPQDGETNAGQLIGPIDFVAIGGDITSRMEAATITQTAKRSWGDFEKVYLQGLHLRNAAGESSPIYVIPGNHDVSNAIGFYKRLEPKTDPTAMVKIYNREMHPEVPLTNESFDYKIHKVHYSRDIGGLHLQFVNVWPDSAERVWMENDLAQLSKGTPVIVFAHDEPEIETKHLVNPNGDHDINKTDKFENIVSEMLKNGTKVDDKSTENERQMAQFFKAHSQIKAYFHGNSHMPDLKVWMGPDYDFMLPALSVDSPVKGEKSAKQEELLSFQVVTVDLNEKKLTVRECFWNAKPKDRHAPLAWGNHATFDFREEITAAPEQLDPPSESSPVIPDSTAISP